MTECIGCKHCHDTMHTYTDYGTHLGSDTGPLQTEIKTYSTYDCRRYPKVLKIDSCPVNYRVMSSWEFPPADKRCGEFVLGYDNEKQGQFEVGRTL
jgi:hypothetical protein